jgi:hypothetical protein
MDSFQYPWDNASAPAAIPSVPDETESKPKPRGRRPAPAGRSTLSVARAAPDWLYHHLTISGPAEAVATFATAARGSGVIPWQLDFAAIEEDIFVRAVSQPAGQRNLTIEGCRILARHFRERVEARQSRAAALIGYSLACPFDLQVLLPVPPSILQLGPNHAAALGWLAMHWGITDRLRQVAVRPKATTGQRLPKGHTAIGYGFFTAGETPRSAVTRLDAQWPALRFLLVPRPSG